MWYVVIQAKYYCIHFFDQIRQCLILQTTTKIPNRHFPDLHPALDSRCCFVPTRVNLENI